MLYILTHNKKNKRDFWLNHYLQKSVLYFVINWNVVVYCKATFVWKTLLKNMIGILDTNDNKLKNTIWPPLIMIIKCVHKSLIISVHIITKVLNVILIGGAQSMLSLGKCFNIIIIICLKKRLFFYLKKLFFELKLTWKTRLGRGQGPFVGIVTTNWRVIQFQRFNLNLHNISILAYLREVSKSQSGGNPINES